jgi:DNA (cytosine-5)-methyltransferase 1
MRELSLFTGAGGGIWATKWILGWEAVGYVESDMHCRRVIVQRIRDGLFDPAPVWGDVRAFIRDGWARSMRGHVDVVTGGFPCQPFSLAGRRKGAGDEQNMWPATAAVLRDVRPRWAMLENVPGLLGSHGYFGRVLGDLAALGYDAEWAVLGAHHAGAPHWRDRLWILARLSDPHRVELWDESRWCGRQGRAGTAQPGGHGQGRPVADAGQLGGDGGRLHPGEIARRQAWAEAMGCRGDRISWWDQDPAEVEYADRSPQPRMGRVAHGVARRRQRLAACGNGQVPAVAALAWGLLRWRYLRADVRREAGRGGARGVGDRLMREHEGDDD